MWKWVVMYVAMLVLLCAGLSFGETTFEIKDGKVVITETVSNIPASRMGPNNQEIQLSAKDTLIRKYDPIDSAAVQMNIIGLTQKRSSITSQYNSDIANIDEQIKLFKDIETALSEPPK